MKDFNAYVGDFVLFRSPKTGKQKLSCKWIGPKHIKEVVTPSTFLVDNIVTDENETVHSRRLVRYRSKLECTEVNKSLLDAVRHNESTFETIEKLIKAKNSKDKIFVQV